MCDCLSAKGVRPTSAATRPADTDTSHKQQNGSVTVSRLTAGGLGDSMVGIHHAVLYVLGEKTQMKVLATSDIRYCQTASLSFSFFYFISYALCVKKVDPLLFYHTCTLTKMNCMKVSKDIHEVLLVVNM